jgi:predicted transcriptional regulator
MIVFTMKHRSRTDIIVNMLEAARHGGTKTKIMYSSYLSSHQFRSYLELLIRNGLLAYDPMNQRYKTTEKGLKVLELYQNIGKLELAPSVRAMSK